MDEIKTIFENALSEASAVECAPADFAEALDEVISTLEASRDAALEDVKRG